MKNSKHEVGSTIRFQESKLPFTIQASDDRYLICTRSFNKKEDDDIVKQGLEMGTYVTKKEALEDLQNLSIYTIVDLEEEIRGADNYNSWSDYSTREECEEVLNALNTNEVEISYRNRLKLNII